MMIELKIESGDVDMDRETSLESMDGNSTVKFESVEAEREHQKASQPISDHSTLEEKIQQARQLPQLSRRVSRPWKKGWDAFRAQQVAEGREKELESRIITVPASAHGAIPGGPSKRELLEQKLARLYNNNNKQDRDINHVCDTSDPEGLVLVARTKANAQPRSGDDGEQCEYLETRPTPAALLHNLADLSKPRTAPSNITPKNVHPPLDMILRDGDSVRVDVAAAVGQEVLKLYTTIARTKDMLASNNTELVQENEKLEERCHVLEDENIELKLLLAQHGVVLEGLVVSRANSRQSEETTENDEHGQGSSAMLQVGEDEHRLPTPESNPSSDKHTSSRDVEVSGQGHTSYADSSTSMSPHSKDQRIDIVEKRLLRFVNKTRSGNYKCGIADCHKTFTDLQYWRRHVDHKHPVWLEDVKKLIAVDDEDETSKEGEVNFDKDKQLSLNIVGVRGDKSASEIVVHSVEETILDVSMHGVSSTEDVRQTTEDDVNDLGKSRYKCRRGASAEIEHETRSWSEAASQEVERQHNNIAPSARLVQYSSSEEVEQPRKETLHEELSSENVRSYEREQSREHTDQCTQAREDPKTGGSFLQEQQPKDIEHELRREIEIKVMALRGRLEDEGMDDLDIQIEAESLRRSLMKEMNTQAAAKPSFEEKLCGTFGLSMSIREKPASRTKQTDDEPHDYENYKPLSQEKDAPKPSPYQHGEMPPKDWIYEYYEDTIRDDGPKAPNYDDEYMDGEPEDASSGRRKISFSLSKGQKKGR